MLQHHWCFLCFFHTFDGCDALQALEDWPHSEAFHNNVILRRVLDKNLPITDGTERQRTWSRGRGGS